MHYIDPSRARTSYALARHDTLNFEACGGEPALNERPAPVPFAPVLSFPGATRSWITVNIHRKDTTMSTTPHDERERVLTYVTSGPLHARVTTRSGDVVVRASDTGEVVVTLRARSSKDSHLLDTADVVFDSASDTLTVRTQPEGVSISSRGRRGPGRSWFDLGSSDLDVTIEAPRGSALDVTTVSGDTSLRGSLGVVSVKSVSGDVLAHDTSEALDVQTASGDVSSGHVLATLKCKSASGDVVCHGAAAHTEIFSASGDVLLSADQPGTIVVRNVSGDVVVRVARGLAVDISGNTVSGDVGSNIDLDGPTAPAPDEEMVQIKVTTVSGDIRIDKAS
jgi:DUF4097 and DUF4098 domain-containing protein YvlB